MSGEFAGALSQRVTIERLVDGIDELGGPLEQWVAEGAAWAAVVPDGFGAAVSADARSARQRYRVTMRARAGFALRHRLRWRGRVLAVLAVSQDSRLPDRVVLMTEEMP